VLTGHAWCVAASAPPLHLFLATLVCNTPPSARLLAPAEAPCPFPRLAAGAGALVGGGNAEVIPTPPSPRNACQF